ncbi:MAG: flagellar basal body protein, partial [Luminiphilus sp.]|nr:flagellar basal body protein [Luminiphilus sp.]
MNIASTALSAQTTRINTIASNMANANTVASTPE